MTRPKLKEIRKKMKEITDRVENLEGLHPALVHQVKEAQMSTLEKAVSQKHLTLDTVDAQFCSDWLKDEITRLFNQRDELRALAQAAIDAWNNPNSKISPAWCDLENYLYRTKNDN